MFPLTMLPFFNWRSSFTLMEPLTFPMISACWQEISPCTVPLAPMITLAEPMMLPIRTPSILKSPLLVKSPFKEVPAPIILALAGTFSLFSDLDFALNIELVLVVNRFRIWNIYAGCIQFYRCFSLQNRFQAVQIQVFLLH